MAGIKKRGFVSENRKRYYQGHELKPTMFVNTNGKQKLCGSANGELIVDSEGKPVPFRSINCD
ncbi:MAG: hypothetical protein CMA31_01995 [Euryarchaeota archaeon]|jgi:hypothetical protein|nr:hypothetical protein [Euryarchaeota archaeon]|tara:strand:+ start:2250 stop:2438 length:189 start_codon:yes stop_codon:yes gene_type:complete